MSGLERAFFGDATRAQIDGWVTEQTEELLGEPVAELWLRAGRIDAVYGLRVGADRVVMKVHRPPVDLPALGAAVEVLGHLHATGYPCPRPIAGPVRRDGQVVTVQSFLGGGTLPDAQLPRVRRLFAASLAEHVEILRGLPPDLVARLGPGPAWTRYHGGPWPEPHDPIFDFSRTPEGWEWLDAFAAAATAELAQSSAATPVVAHGDWYVGNVRVEGGRVVAVYDWDFVVEPEPVVVGLSAGGLLLEGAPSPADVAAFVDDYAQVSPAGLDEAQRGVAAAAARWVLAFNARCDLAMLSGEPDPTSALGRLLDHRAAYG
ncbi:MAG TPA: phosphotransferase [Pseudonocardia sp.]|nr:phosphotransferase [Pseudonocardia sp.]